MRKRAESSPWRGPLWGERTLPSGRGKRKMLGYWGPDEPELPDPEQLIDSNWDVATRRRIVRYLSRRAFLLPYIAAGWSVCRLCVKTNGSREMSDGVYVWPDGLGHYVRDHGVRLPDDVVEHILTAEDPGGPQHRVSNGTIDWGTFPHPPPWVSARLRALEEESRARDAKKVVAKKGAPATKKVPKEGNVKATTRAEKKVSQRTKSGGQVTGRAAAEHRIRERKLPLTP